MAGDILDLKIDWYMPGESGRWGRPRGSGKEVLGREQMLSCLSMVWGTGDLLPSWGEGLVVLHNTRLNLKHQARVAFKGQVL